MKTTVTTALAALCGLALPAAADIKIAHVYDKTGALEAYARQSHIGLMMGLEYATGGTMEINGEKITVIEKDSQLKPDVGRAMLAEAYNDDDVDLAVGGTGSGVALAMLPVAEENEKILIVEPAVADTITGEAWNRYIFRTGRNSSQDAISNAVALGREGVKIVTFAQDYAFGRDGIKAFKEALAGTKAELVAEEYAPTDTTDFTAFGERMFNALKDVEGEKRIFIIWAGANNPMSKLKAMDPSRFGIELATGGNILEALKAYKEFPGLEGSAYYYYDIPKNPVNEWFVKEHMARHNSPPDFFTAGGMSAGIAAVEAIKKAGSTETEALIAAMEGLSFETPKGKMTFRPEDHQALQEMYHFKIKVDPAVEWGIPELIRTIPIEEMQIPIRNKR